MGCTHSPPSAAACRPRRWPFCPHSASLQPLHTCPLPSSICQQLLLHHAAVKTGRACRIGAINRAWQLGANGLHAQSPFSCCMPPTPLALLPAQCLPTASAYMPPPQLHLPAAVAAPCCRLVPSMGKSCK
ncbi:hypothetical protein GOBAR_AA11452 [Gossypium barbadense]|uniref:Uncharacterized protein n=1 Tax=Gossypium barbadense TaxID=3634 RepID=A0A2P5Y0T3_GOSBA|nr:hypothetical protein GOBAR_AA11452 [Gossypium barbadense]